MLSYSALIMYSKSICNKIMYSTLLCKVSGVFRSLACPDWLCILWIVHRYWMLMGMWCVLTIPIFLSDFNVADFYCLLYKIYTWNVSRYIMSTCWNKVIIFFSGGFRCNWMRQMFFKEKYKMQYFEMGIFL